MKYVPYLFSLQGEIDALQNQNFSTNIIPLINIVKDKKTKKSSKSILDDIEVLIKSKSSNSFFINVPMNLDLSKRELKNPIKAFYKDITLIPNYQLDILKRFEKNTNVIPTIDVNSSPSKYISGELQNIRSNLSASKVAYIIYSKKFTPLFSELSSLITKNDILIYYLDTNSLFKKSIKKEIFQINQLKSKINFKTIAIKQIFDDLTFPKLPNGEIQPGTDADDCIDSDFIDNFTSFNFDYFGDHGGIRSIPIYKGGLSYPAFIALNTSTYSHFGFKGLERDINSYSSTLLPNIINSNYWNNILNQTLKQNSYGCQEILKFSNLNIKAGDSNPINNATTWKSITLSHYLSIIDYKIKNNMI